MPGACSAAAVFAREFHGIAGAVGLAVELAAAAVAGRGRAAAMEAHHWQLMQAAALGLRSRTPYLGGFAHRGRPCSHIARNPGRTVMPVQAAGTRECRWWAAGQRTVDCAAAMKPMDLHHREDPSRGPSSPWQQ